MVGCLSASPQTQPRDVPSKKTAIYDRRELLNSAPLDRPRLGNTRRSAVLAGDPSFFLGKLERRHVPGFAMLPIIRFPS